MKCCDYRHEYTRQKLGINNFRELLSNMLFRDRDRKYIVVLGHFDFICETHLVRNMINVGHSMKDRYRTFNDQFTLSICRGRKFNRYSLVKGTLSYFLTPCFYQLNRKRTFIRIEQKKRIKNITIWLSYGSSKFGYFRALDQISN